MSNQQPRTPVQQPIQTKTPPVEDRQKAKMLMSRFTPLNDYLKMNQDQRENLATLFAAGATFKQSCAQSFDTEEKKKNYFNTQWNRIVFTAIYLMDIDFANFDNFSISFFTWIQEEHIKFPIKKQELKYLHEQNMKKKAQSQMVDEGNELEEEKKRKQLEQIEQQKKEYERKMAEQKKQRQRLLEAQRQVEKQKLLIRQNYEKNQLRQRMVDEGQERLNPGRLSIEKSPHPRPPQRSTSPARENKYAAALSANNINANQQNPYKNQTKSPMPNTGQRIVEADYGRRNEPIFMQKEPTKEEMIRRVLAKICDCHECPEKRTRILGQIKSQLDNMRKLEELEKPNIKIDKK